MQFKSTFFEDYELGSKRVTLGRTITETDFVVHAGHTGDFFPVGLEHCADQAEVVVDALAGQLFPRLILHDDRTPLGMKIDSRVQFHQGLLSGVA